MSGDKTCGDAGPEFRPSDTPFAAKNVSFASLINPSGVKVMDARVRATASADFIVGIVMSVQYLITPTTLPSVS